MAVHVAGTGGDQAGVRLIGHVVVVSVESATGNPIRGGEGVELVQIGITDEMSPQAAVRRPQRIVDQDRHVPILFTRDDTWVTAFACGPGIR
jgi:hypothetical protein